MKRNTWHQLAAHPEVCYGQYIVPNFVSNSVAIKISDHEFIVISPGASLIESWLAKWQGSGMTLHIIMPNHYHFMGVKAWQAQFPNALLYASEKAIRQLNKKGLGDILPLECEPPPLPERYHILFPPGHRGGDVWLSKQDEATGGLWITCDSFLNYDRLSRQSVAKTMQRLLGAAPGLKMSQVIKWFILDDKQEFKAWALSQLGRDKPGILIPAHGEVCCDTALSEKLKALIVSRL